MEEICQCSRCGLRGYYLLDTVRNLCHLCIQREQHIKNRLIDLCEIRDDFLCEFKQKYRLWNNCEFAKAFIGNSILDAIREVTWNQYNPATVTPESYSIYVSRTEEGETM